MNFADTVMGLALTLAIGIPLVVAAVLVRQLITIARRSRRRNLDSEPIADVEQAE